MFLVIHRGARQRTVSEARERNGKVGSLAMRVILYLLIYIERDLTAVYSIFFLTEKLQEYGEVSQRIISTMSFFEENEFSRRKI